MQIVAVETYRVPPRWLFVKVVTDEGVIGWGEAVLEGHASGAEATIKELSELVIGVDPLRINDTWQLLFRNGCYRSGPLLMSALSGIDMALWDISGKYYGVPVSGLLGGQQRDRVRTYTWIGGDSPADLIDGARIAMDQGFTAVKFNASGPLQMVADRHGMAKVVERIGALRGAVGHHLGLIVDFHGRVHRPVAQGLIQELEPFHPMWIEDPVPADNPGAVIELARRTTVPIAVGERVHTRSEFLTLLESRAVGILNPDPVHMGGISQTVKLAGAAEMYDVAIAPHCPLGPIALAACLQIDAVCYNAVIQEQSLGIHYNTDADLLDYVNGVPFSYESGYLGVPQGPGLGIDVNETLVAERSKSAQRWSAPVWRHPDGSIAEW